MQRKIITTTIILVFLLMGCVSQQGIQDNKKWAPIYRLQVGANKGGVVENTDMAVVDNAGVDAFSGATRRGVNASAKVLLPVRTNYVETGVDLMHNSQTFTYNDAVNNFMGERKLGVTQFMVPLTYSIGIIRQNHPEGLFQLKFGYAAQFNLFSISDGQGNMPAYSTNSFSNGATLGLSTAPFRLNNGLKLGFFVDGYRGTRAYEDFYNQPEFEIPGTSFIKYGIIFQF
ncbi:MAG: hypothetical protein ACK4VN_16525 [Bacteroidales bacterium]